MPITSLGIPTPADTIKISSIALSIRQAADKIDALLQEAGNGAGSFRGELPNGTDLHTLDSLEDYGTYRLLPARTFGNQPPTVSSQYAVLLSLPAGTSCTLLYLAFNMIWWQTKTTDNTWGAWRQLATTSDIDGKMDRNRGLLARNTDLNTMYTDSFNGVYGYNKDFTYPGAPADVAIDRHSIFEVWASGSSTALQRISNSKDVVIRELESSSPSVVWGAWRRLAFADESTAANSNITAQAAVYNRENGLQLYGKKPNSVEIAASLTKTLALYIARQTVNDAMLDNTVTVLGADIRYSDPTPTLADGDILTYRDLIYLSALPSHNGATDVLARVVGETLAGTGDGRTKFIAKMNATATSWGWTGASFVEPTGVNPGNMISPNQVTELMFRIHTDDPWLSSVGGTLTHEVSITGPNPRTATVAHSIDPSGTVKFPEFVAGKTGTYQGGSVAMLVQDSPAAPLACVVVMRSQPATARYDEARLILDGWAT